MPKNGTIEKRTIAVQTRQLPCELTEVEERELGKKLAHLEGALASHEAGEKEVKDQLKSKRSSLEGQIHGIAGVIRQGHEYRPVDVKIEADYSASRVYEIRQDTGEVITDRPLREDERQTSLLDEPVEDEPTTEAPKRGKKKVAPPPLTWGRENGMEIAYSNGGEYRVIGPTPDSTWNAEWVPEKGRAKSLSFSPTEADAKKACDQHHLERGADAILKNAGTIPYTNDAIPYDIEPPPDA